MRLIGRKVYQHRLHAELLERRLMLYGPGDDVLFRVNAGGTVLEGDPAWEADTGNMPSNYLDLVAFNSSPASTELPISLDDPSIPLGTPAALFQTERYDLIGGSEMSWNFPLDPGQYEVRLYFAETFEYAQLPGFRVFDVAIEGNLVLDDYDVFADVGGYVGVMKSFVVASDDVLDIDFTRVTENPAIKGIEILSSETSDGVLAVSSSLVDFANVLVGDEVTQTVTLTNTSAIGGSDITVDPTQSTITPGDVGFTIEFLDPAPIVISAGGATDVEVSFAPLVEGAANATFSIAHSGINSPVEIALSGNGQVLGDGDVVYRVNSGGIELAETPVWESDTFSSPSPYLSPASTGTGTSVTNLPIDLSDPSVPIGTPEALFQSERFDLSPAGTDLSWDFPVIPGTYEVRLFFAEIFEFGQAPGLRVFDVSIEGGLVLDDYDVFADVGGYTGVMKSFMVASDGNLDIDFTRVIQNPALTGIEILSSATSDGVLAVSSSSIDFANVVIGQSAQQSVTLTNASALGGSEITIDPAQALLNPASAGFDFQFQGSSPIVLAPGDATDVQLSFTPQIAGAAAATFSVAHSGANTPLNVTLMGNAQTFGGGEVLYRVNAGGVELSDTPVWESDTFTQPSPYLDPNSTGTGTSATALSIDLSDPSVPVGTPAEVFQSERFDLSPAGIELSWDFPVTPGQYEVRLYFAEIFEFGQSTGSRVFDVLIEGGLVLDDYDVFAEVGGYKGVVKSFTVTSDSSLDLDFARVIENPAIKGIEILAAEASDGVLAVSSTSLDFANVVVGQSAQQIVTLTNTSAMGGSDITIDPSQSGIVPNDTDFDFSFVDPTPLVLGPGASTDVELSFAPLVAGLANATFSIAHSGSNTPLDLALSGNGQDAVGGQVLYRINAGGDELAGTPVWEADTFTAPSTYLSPTSVGTGTSATAEPIDLTDGSVPVGTPEALFQSDRFDLSPGGTDLSWDFPVTPGEYEVRLYFAEIFEFGQSAGFRSVDVSIEGGLVLDDYDVFAEVGGYKGVVKTFTVTSDANLDVDFARVMDNPSVKGIEILAASDSDGVLAISSSAIDFANVLVGQTAEQTLTLTNAGSAGDSDITIDPMQSLLAPSDVGFSFEFASTIPIVLPPGASTDVDLSFTPPGVGVATAIFSVAHTGINSPSDVTLSGNGQVVSNNPVLYRVNAGGGGLFGTPVWTADTFGFPSDYVANPADSGVFTVLDAIDLSDPSVPAGTPEGLFQSERFDLAPDGTEMSWDFPVATGEYEVRLYFAETFEFGQSNGFRVFDVAIEGALVLDDYDVFADVGGYTGVMKSFIVNSDNNIDIDFTRVANNPAIKGIEILSTAAIPLQPSTDELFFGTLAAGQTTPLNFTLTNNDAAAITIDPAEATLTPVDAPFLIDFVQSTVITLNPGETTTVSVTFAPTGIGLETAMLSVVHSGANSPIPIGLEGVGVDPNAINFNKSVLATLTGITNPTTLQFGPDGRLYVGEQTGLIHALTIVRNGPSAYQVVDQEFITQVRDLPNHNDLGVPEPSVYGRLMTGLLVAGDASQPVLYVSSSDPRIGAGPDGFDLNLDTNSGVITRLTWNGSSWDQLDLVRGLPRSEENHGPNGLQLDPTGTKLLVAVGGNTNSGAPSNNFALLPEYALSAAIVEIDLVAIGDTTYDLPTLDDEDRPGAVDANDPFGGNDGKNQARLVPGGPVQVHAPGFRNPYDLLVNSAGKLYTIDNGPNAGWGEVPVGEGPAGNATNDPNEPGLTYGDGLHFIDTAGYYGGHPNPTRSNPANTFNPTNPQSPVTVGNPIESDFQIPGVEDGSLYVFGASTNGLAEYTAGSFSGQLAGKLLTASFDNTIQAIELNAAGDAVIAVEPLFNNVGIVPLDVTAPTGVFFGTVWVVDIATSNVYVFEPSDGTGGSAGDLDGDGYSNDDELANGTDPLNGADIPPDNDADFLSDLLDPDDDNDAQDDLVDPFAIDADNGLTTPVGTFYDWENDSVPPGGLLGLGFTGLMLNGTDYLDQYDPSALTAGGAAGVLTLDAADSGTATGAANTQTQAFQFGVNVGAESEPFVARTRVVAPFLGQSAGAGQEIGFFVGTGDQDNYLKFVIEGDGSLALQLEVEGVVTSTYRESAALTLPGPATLDFFLTIDPQSQALQASYAVDQGPHVDFGPGFLVPAAWLQSVLAIGITSTDPADSGLMSATWDFLGIVPEPKHRAYAKVDFPSTFGTGSFTIRNDGDVRIASYLIDLSTAFLPDIVFDPDGTAGDVGGKPFTPDEGEMLVGLTGHQFLVPQAGGFEVLEIFFDDFEPGEEFKFSVDIDPTSILGAAIPGPNDSGSVSGFEVSGATVTVSYSDGETYQNNLFPAPFSDFASEAVVIETPASAPSIELFGVGSPSVVSAPLQTLEIKGNPGSYIRVFRVEGGLFLDGVPNGGFDVSPFEINSLISYEEQQVTLDGAGVGQVDFTLTRTDPDGGLNYFFAAWVDINGDVGRFSNVFIAELAASPPPLPWIPADLGTPLSPPPRGSRVPLAPTPTDLVPAVPPLSRWSGHETRVRRAWGYAEAVDELFAAEQAGAWEVLSDRRRR